MNFSACKILVLPYTPTLSHLSRPLEISKKLSLNGCAISFGGNSSKTSFIRDEGFEVHPIYEPDPDLLFNNIRNKKIKFIDNHIIDHMIESDLQLFNKIKPDLVITDGRFSAMVSTQIAGVKHISIVNASSTSYRAIPYFPILKGDKVDQYPPVSFLPRLLNPINIKFEMFVFDNIMGVFKSLSKKYRLKHNVTATNCLCGVGLTLLADIPEFFPTKNIPFNYHYIGPVTWKAPKSKELPEWWPVNKNGKKLVYLTMGTTGESDLFQKVYDTFKNSQDIISIITTGNQSDGIKSIPGKVYVTDFMDGDMIMEKADIVVCHGGNGTIYQALSHGKPIIGIPTIPDQEFNMRRVTALGTGKSISLKKAVQNPGSIIEAIQEMIQRYSVYKENTTKIKKILQKYDGANTGATIIKQFLKAYR